MANTRRTVTVPVHGLSHLLDPSLRAWINPSRIDIVSIAGHAQSVTNQPLENNHPNSLEIELAPWIWERSGERFETIEERMDAVIQMARRNIGEGGGPFAAAVFDATGQMVGPGVNRVVAASVPIAHAEIVAIAMAGQHLSTWDLASMGDFELVSTTEPCAMCLGAVPWSGVRRLVCGARDADARAVGFDEGRKPGDWVEHLASIGIEAVLDVQRAEAVELLQSYASGGGAIYNGAS